MSLIGGTRPETADDTTGHPFITDQLRVLAIEKEGSKDGSFKTLRERMTPEAQTVAREKTASMMKDMSLHELRSAPELTQGSLAEQLDLEQPSEILTLTPERDER